MCDTWAALPDTTATGQLIFAKNSDRPAFDCQPLVYRPRQSWPAGTRVATEYLSLPQVETTHAHLGSRPYWSFGYESGLNEHGLVIGNEAVFTRPWRQAVIREREEAKVSRGLIGMAMIRLALERARSASAAVDLMGGWVEAHGQFGSGVPGKPHADGSYDNSFIIADRTEAWVLETCGRNWAARRLTQGYTSISNQPSLRRESNRTSAGLRAEAVKQGWWAATDSRPFDFAEAFADELVPRQVSHLRVMRSRQLLQERAGRIDAAWMKRIARDHYEGTFLEGPLFNAADPDVLTLCMHESPAAFTWGNTAASTIVVQPAAGGGVPVFWWTPGPPCNGCYVPFFVEAKAVPPMVSRAGSRYPDETVVPPDRALPDTHSGDSYWWLFRQLLDVTTGGAGHRGSLYAQRNQIVRGRFDALEVQFESELGGALAAYSQATDAAAGAEILSQFTARCVNVVTECARELLQQFGQCGGNHTGKA
jgi:secernin